MEKFERLNYIANQTNTNFFQIHSFDGSHLSIVGSFDLTCYKEIEISFQEVTFLSLPVFFSFPEFSAGDSKEREELEQMVGLELQDIVYRIEARTSPGKKLPFYIVAESFQVREINIYN